MCSYKDLIADIKEASDDDREKIRTMGDSSIDMLIGLIDDGYSIPVEKMVPLLKALHLAIDVDSEGWDYIDYMKVSLEDVAGEFELAIKKQHEVEARAHQKDMALL